jgi:hypothetical protein
VAATIGAAEASGWRVVGTGDFDSDSRTDLVLQHRDGKIAFWLMNGTSLVSGRILNTPPLLEPSLRIRAIADLNKDKQLDLLVEDPDGSMGALILNGTLLLEKPSLDFEVELVPPNAAPTILPIESVVLKPGSAFPAIPLKGIGAGATSERQVITVTAVSDNPKFIPNPEVSYATAAGEGTLVLAPVAGQIGEAIISVIVKDNGGTANGGQDTTVIRFKVTVTGDSLQNIYFQHDDGSLAVWEMNGAHQVRASYLDPVRPSEAGWIVRATADFDKDGKTDLLFQKDDGSLAVWFMDGAKLKSGALLNPTTTGDRNWQVVGADDMDGDGQVDVLFQHSENGTLAAWLMDGLKVRQVMFLNPSTPEQGGSKVIGTGDFNRDGKADLLFERADGAIAFWLMEGTKLVEGKLLNPVPPVGQSWRVQGIIDLNKDQQVDLVVQKGDGSLTVLFLNGTEWVQFASLDPSQAGPGWRIVGP